MHVFAKNVTIEIGSCVYLPLKYVIDICRTSADFNAHSVYDTANRYFVSIENLLGVCNVRSGLVHFLAVKDNANRDHVSSWLT